MKGNILKHATPGEKHEMFAIYWTSFLDVDQEIGLSLISRPTIG